MKLRKVDVYYAYELVLKHKWTMNKILKNACMVSDFALIKYWTRNEI